MAKLDILRLDVTQTNKFVLEMEQWKMISMYEEVLNSKSVSQYLYALGTNGYMTFIERQKGKFSFVGCNDEHVHRVAWNPWLGPKMTPANVMFEEYVISMCKRLLTAWHQKKGIARETHWSTKDRPVGEGLVYLDLDKKQRGILTKILKMHNKRKKVVRV